jgi:hypothetical protein
MDSERRFSISVSVDHITLRDELTALLNKHSRENISNTPDFILAYYLLDCLSAFDKATLQRDDWYGVKLEPGISRKGWDGIAPALQEDDDAR